MEMRLAAGTVKGFNVAETTNYRYLHRIQFVYTCKYTVISYNIYVHTYIVYEAKIKKRTLCIILLYLRMHTIYIILYR